MENEDKFLKELEKIVSLLKKFKDQLELLEGMEKSEGLNRINQALKKGINLDIQEIAKIPSVDLVDTLVHKKKLSTFHVSVLADFFYDLGESYDQSGERENAKLFFEKTLTLYQYLSVMGKTSGLDRHFKIEQIRNLLK